MPARIGGWLYSLLRAFVEEHGLGRVLTGILMETGVHLAGRVPDVLFLSLEDGLYRSLPVEADGTVRSCVIPGRWLRPEWLVAEPRPKLLEVLRAWGLV